MDSSTSDTIEIAKMYPKHGVVGFLPTSVSFSQDMVIKSLRSIQKC
jgi:N-acetylglucosamine-6-phosphate deacetylase